MDGSTSLPANWAWLVPGWFLAHVCYQSPVYQILDDEVVVRAAVSTHCVEHVPQCTVTGVTVKRDALDRRLGIDSFGLQTAGVSSAPGPQDSLVRVRECQGMYQPLAAAVRRRWGGAPSTGGGDEALVQDSAVRPPLTDY